ncbi:hypothetical protein PMNALOAF_1088 [Methylobacterium adhaesivum]|nr:hypothetical protein PMNALOAF_1088 [Methylobacterium adhaesivum]
MADPEADPNGTPPRSRRDGHGGPADTLTPSLSLDRIGQALASFYDDLIAEGVPEHLAALVRQVRAPEHAPRAAAPAALSAKSGKFALVVEDEATVRAMAEALLEETELGVLGCDSAEAAIEIMRQRGGDVALVFADVHLAGVMDGVQLASAIALLWPTTRLVVTSGQRAERPSALAPQAVFIPKPWRPLDLLGEVERARVAPQPLLP